MMIHTLTALAVAGRRAVTVVTARLAQPENPNACLPPGFSSPVSTALGWVKALGLVVAIVASACMSCASRVTGFPTVMTRSTSSSTGWSASSLSPGH